MKTIWNNHSAEYSSNQCFRMYWKAIEQAREPSFKFLVSHKHGQCLDLNSKGPDLHSMGWICIPWARFAFQKARFAFHGPDLHSMAYFWIPRTVYGKYYVSDLHSRGLIYIPWIVNFPSIINQSYLSNLAKNGYKHGKKMIQSLLPCKAEYAQGMVQV